MARLGACAARHHDHPRVQVRRISNKTIVDTAYLGGGTISGSNTTVASVATDFTEFKDGISPTLALLGRLKTTLTEGLVAADGGSFDYDELDTTALAAAFSWVGLTLSEVNQQDMKFGTFFLDLDPDNATADPPTSSNDCVSATVANLKNFAFADNNGKPFATGTIVGSLPTTNLIVDAGICVRLTKRGDPAVQAPVPTAAFKAKIDFSAPAVPGGQTRAGKVAPSITGDGARLGARACSSATAP